MRINSTKPICLIGRVYDSIIDQCSVKSLFIDNGTIIKIIEGKSDSDLLPDSFIIELEDNEVIFPSFINLHTHIGYNVLPLWNSPHIWYNRHQWRNSPQYEAEIKDFTNFIKKEWASKPALLESFIADFIPATKLASLLYDESNSSYREFYMFRAITEVERIHAILSEIQAVCGGTGLLLQTLSLDEEDPEMKHFLIRNTGNSEDMGINKSLKVFPVVDFYNPKIRPDGTPVADTSNWSPEKQGKLDNYINSVNQNNANYYSTIAHIGEGKSGNLYNATKDKYSLNECKQLFHELKQKVKSQYLRESNLILVHANGIDYEDSDTISFLKDNNISIVWSPVSNLLLYNDTLPIEKLLDENINVCLGTDWTPSGSKHMLDEMKFARYYCDYFNIACSDKQIFDMSTTNAAKALGNLKYSVIQDGAFADLFVYKTNNLENLLGDFLQSDDEKIKFSMINGRIIYGDTIVFENMKVDYQKFPDDEGEFSKVKAISINANLNFNLENAIKKMDSLIKAYSTETLGQELFRTKFLSSDDQVYKDRISKLMQSL
ncbi:amidohydrolase family protein [uncultured Chryseobacterium sp.]|uniref:amidohydrolase family protein n=1 Tax=uncultured Chryseobacterium sp. TaxID=259322 RepID=UPI00258B0EBE|nr:amidohydrolase family protein [uncultured Chryseobacterium sp.]